MAEVKWSEVKDEFETPPALFQQLDAIFHFTLDPCATHENKLVSNRYFTKKDNGLIQLWNNHAVFMNPPYSQWKSWVQKAVHEMSLLVPPRAVVALVPADTSTKAFQLCRTTARCIDFLPRLRYYYKGKPAPYPARFASMLVYWW